MKYTVIPGVILTKICDEDFLVATGPARGRVPYVEGINSTGAYFFSKILDGLFHRRNYKRCCKII